MADGTGCFLPINMRNAFLVLAAYIASGRKVSAGGGTAAGTAGTGAGTWQSPCITECVCNSFRGGVCVIGCGFDRGNCGCLGSKLGVVEER